MTNVDTPEWRTAPGLVAYPDALSEMENRVDAVINGTARELIWLVEHPPLYTAGTSAVASDLKDATRFPVYETGRGGQYTYHGPGQRVLYAMLNLAARDRDLRAHVWRLEEWVIRVLADFGVKGERRTGRVGIWVVTPAKGSSLPQEEKIAAIGVRVRKWVTYHGLALNVAPDLSHYNGIVPCGLAQYGVTSLQKLGIATSLADVDAAFLKHKDVLESVASL